MTRTVISSAIALLIVSCYVANPSRASAQLFRRCQPRCYGYVLPKTADRPQPGQPMDETPAPAKSVEADAEPAVEATVAFESVTYEVFHVRRHDPTLPHVPSGAALTLTGSFFGNETGMVLFRLGSTSAECEIIYWGARNVTTQLPKIGLREPRDAEIQVVRADGRIAKSFLVALVAPPDVIVHEESIPQPAPPVPNRSCQASVGADGESLCSSL